MDYNGQNPPPVQPQNATPPHPQYIPPPPPPKLKKEKGVCRAYHLVDHWRCRMSLDYWYSDCNPRFDCFVNARQL